MNNPWEAEDWLQEQLQNAPHVQPCQQADTEPTHAGQQADRQISMSPISIACK